MEIAQIDVSGVRARAIVYKPIPMGLIGGTVRFAYSDPLWDGLTKTVVFSCGDVTKDVLSAGELVTIPPEITLQVRRNVLVGVYGTDSQQNLVIPTLWATIGMVRDATSPSGDTSTDESIPVWAQLRDMIGNLEDLDTDAKENLVAAINEAVSQETLKQYIMRAEEAAEQSEAAASRAEEIQESIAEDHTELDSSVKRLKDDLTYLAPSIVCNDSGTVISLDDGSNRILQGLRIYGRTTQDGTPTPEAPVELVSAGAGGTVGIKVSGKNLLHYPYRETTKTENGVSFTDNGDGSITINGTATTDTWFNLMKFNLGKRWGSSQYRLAPYIFSGVPKEIKLDYSPNSKLTYITVPSGVTIDTTVYPQVEIGDDATAWEPPMDEQTITVQTPNGLPGIPVTSGGNYTDENGQQWICDEVDFARGVYVQRIMKLSLNISDMNNSEGYPGWKKVSGVINSFGSTTINIPEGRKGLCNIGFPTVRAVGINNINNNGIIYLPKEVWGLSQAEWKAQYPNLVFEIAFPMNTTIETALSDDELSAYAALHTNKPNTTIYNDAGAYMDVEYVADTKLYIDKKINELATAIVSGT